MSVRETSPLILDRCNYIVTVMQIFVIRDSHVLFVVTMWHCAL